MSSSSSDNRDPLAIAHEAERDLASRENNPSGTSLRQDLDRSQEAGVHDDISDKFPGSSVVTGSAASGQGDNREIPVGEGGGFDDRGRVTKAKDFEGEGGPEDKLAKDVEERGGDDDVKGNVR